MKISYAITACNEKENLEKLIPFLIENKDVEDEIIILFDVKNGDENLLDFLLKFNLLPNVQVWRGFDFNNDFAEWKNKLNDYCSGDYIFQLDGDEIVNPILVKNLKRILEVNPAVDLFLVPRINIVNDITEYDIKLWKWTINEKGWINWPDKQGRIYKKGLKWSGNVHETISEAKLTVTLPETQEFSLIHIKDIKKQKEQNNKYVNLILNQKKSLNEIYNKYSLPYIGQGDKGTIHTYIDVYDRVLAKYRNDSTVLEIGLFDGLSLKMFAEYFLNSNVYGVDIHLTDELRKTKEEGYNVIIDDATAPQFLDKIGNLKFDVVIDDGSHRLEDQIKSFLLLKPRMNEGGIYIIEDIVNLDYTHNYFRQLHSNIEIIDNRHLRNLHDDVLIIYRF